MGGERERGIERERETESERAEPEGRDQEMKKHSKTQLSKTIVSRNGLTMYHEDKRTEQQITSLI